MKSDQKPYYDAGIPNPIILQMNYAQAIKRSACEVTAARAAAAAAAAATFSYAVPPSITTTTATVATKTTRGAARVSPQPIWTTARGRSDSCMSDVSDAGSTTSSPSSSVSNTSNDSIYQLPLQRQLQQQQQQRAMAVRDSSPSPSASYDKSSSSSAKERSLESKRRASRKKNQKRREAAKKNKALLNASNASLFTSSSDSLIEEQEDNTAPLQHSLKLEQDLMSNTSSASLPMSPPESPSLADESSPSPDTFAASTPATSYEGEMDKDAILETIVDNKDQETENKISDTIIHSTQEDEKSVQAQMQQEHAEPSSPAPQKEPIAIESFDEQESTLTVDNKAETADDTLPTVMEGSEVDLATDAETIPVATASAPLVLAEENVWSSSASPAAADKDITKVEVETIPADTMMTATAQIDQQSLKQIPLDVEHEPAEPSAMVSSASHNDNSASTVSQPILSSWDVASERVATVALQCLTKDQEMELSYVAILSAITVLQSKEDHQPDFEDLDRPLSAEVKAYKTKVAASYSQILDILCRSDVAEGLGKETLRQGVMAPEELYAQLYGSIQQAGYDLQDDAHLSMAQYWTDRKKIEEAQECIHRIEASRWTSAVYRAAITCHLFAKPRQSQEAEVLLQKYVDSQEASQGQVEAESKIRTWYRLQLDASKWEEVKTQYERRRARLIDAPANIERVEAESRLTPQALQQLQEQQRSPQLINGHKRSVSIASSTTSSSHRRTTSGQIAGSLVGHQRTPSSSHQRTPSGALNWPSGAAATLNAPDPAAAKSGFSFLSPFKFGSKSTNTETTQSPATPTALPSRIHVNRHLTVLDNNMLEECIAHKEFEYGWKNVYERMGPSLEDGETAKIAMRLCRRAFLGHSGMSPNEPGSPNVVAKNFSFGPADQRASLFKQAPELWEARAWVIYNKAMLGSSTFLSSSSSGAGSTSNGTSGASPAGSASMSVSMFMHDILTIAIHSPEVSSRYLKAFKVYSGMRSDAHYHQQLRDQFVMGLMLKAIYDAVLAVINNPDQQLPKTSEQKAEAKKHNRRSSSLSLNRAQPMTLGPLMDLAFEIYADMRNVGPIRHLPSLVSLAPTSPTSKRSSQTSLSRISTNSSRSVTSQAEAPSETTTSSTVSISPRSSFTVLSMPVFQDLNATLKANPQARRLAPELYLALLHLCIHVPVFRISSQIVKTIVNDMSAGSARQVLHLDLHLSAALQSYHDTWMCSVGSTTNDDGHGANDDKCDYFEWMYQSEEAFQDQLSKTNRLSTQSMMSMASATSSSGGVDAAVDELEKELEEAQLAFGSDANGETCNDQLYWDLWSMEDAALKSVQFSKKKAAMLWSHVSRALL
ncbi:hypothetical protein BG015_010068 [Linnemannia schmuckeri]|uniref:Uncharacterized protein n=1 Tax=Linnemannia schmuckeri TaxID=64567 RepID=A0A9P5RWP1_9FUNG|nr:hypothetical protein BG015_010068 [Linnemannia schmuckeri]